MEQPLGFQSSQALNRVCKLHKALYVKKQAPRAWFEKLHGALLSFGFSLATYNQSLFIKITPECILCLLLYVDDLLITGSDPCAITNLIRDMNTEFTVKDLRELVIFLEYK